MANLGLALIYNDEAFRKGVKHGQMLKWAVYIYIIIIENRKTWIQECEPLGPEFHKGHHRTVYVHV